MIVKAPAKINLMLDIMKKLDNGYHSLFMIMQTIDLFDIVEVNKNNLNKIVIECDNELVPCNEKNIAYKCAKAFFNYCNINDGVTINIQKNIPMAAGIAGGSADGAAVLFSLNKIYNTNLSQKDLCSIGSSIGSDVPFSLVGGTAVVMGTGNIIAPVKNIDNKYIVVVKPNQDISTPKAYSQYDELKRVRHIDRVSALEAAENGDYKKICSLCNNVFEQAIEVPKRPHIKSIMKKCGCDACCMSGSGPSIFALFSDKENAENCFKNLKKQYDDVFLCKPCCHGVIEY